MDGRQGTADRPRHVRAPGGRLPPPGRRTPAVRTGPDGDDHHARAAPQPRGTSPRGQPAAQRGPRERRPRPVPGPRARRHPARRGRLRRPGAGRPRRGHLPPPGRDPPRPRTGRRPDAALDPGTDGPAPRRPLRPALRHHHRPPPPAPDDAHRDRLEPRTVRAGRAAAVGPALGVHRGLRRRSGARGVLGRPAARRAGGAGAGGAGGEVGGPVQPGAGRGRPLPAAGHDPRVRPGLAGGTRRGTGDRRPARPLVRGALEGRRPRLDGPRPGGLVPQDDRRARAAAHRPGAPAPLGSDGGPGDGRRALVLLVLLRPRRRGPVLPRTGPEQGPSLGGRLRPGPVGPGPHHPAPGRPVHGRGARQGVHRRRGHAGRPRAGAARRVPARGVGADAG